MQYEKLARMANQIATAFGHLPLDRAAGEVAMHIESFWDPRMRAQLDDIVQNGSGSLLPAVVEAAKRLRVPVADKS